jgi:predicted transcriptional regulator
MKHIQHSVRLSPALNRTLGMLAEQRGMTCYQLLGRAIEAGLASMIGTPSAQPSMAAFGDDIAARLFAIEALVDRGLFTASAAYVYARRAALRGEGDVDKLDASLGDAVQSAYHRQRALASEIL